MPEGYDAFLKDLKERIRNAQLRAALSVNRELVLLYWQTGRDILDQQHQHGWGAKVIDRLAADLHHAFPEMLGFSPRNLKYMRAFAQAWPDEAIVQQLAAQIPWFHNCILLDKVKDPIEREGTAEGQGQEAEEVHLAAGQADDAEDELGRFKYMTLAELEQALAAMRWVRASS